MILKLGNGVYSGTEQHKLILKGVTLGGRRVVVVTG